MAALDLPGRIRAGALTYRVVPLSPAQALANDRYGETSHPEQVVRVVASMGGERAAETLLHEALHVVWNMQGLGQTTAGEHEEVVVNALARGLAGVVRDNPDLMPAIARLFAAAPEDRQ